MNLFEELNKNVLPTNLTRKLTINGETKSYQVYKININLLYYNDQNDRISSWISQYHEEKGGTALYALEKDEYNKVIENFIISSNPSSIEKTALNIKLIGQREPGVVLSDGRIVDGNRRFTCIRKLNKSDPNQCWFESVILDLDINNNKKMIKMLELIIQHGEEKRVDYNHIELLIGIYKDVVETQLLTAEEYAKSTNQTFAEVNKKINASKLLIDFLEYIRMPKQYHVAREFQLVSLLNDLQELLKKCHSDDMKNKLKRIVFLNHFMRAFSDNRRFISDLVVMISNGKYYLFEKKQLAIEEKVFKRFELSDIKCFDDLNTFVIKAKDLTEELKEVTTYYRNASKIIEVQNKPSQSISKTIIALNDIDKNIVAKLTPGDKDKIINQLSKLSSIIEEINNAADGPQIFSKKPEEIDLPLNMVAPTTAEPKKKDYKIIESAYEEQMQIHNLVTPIQGLLFTLDIKNNCECENEYKLFCLDNYNNVVSNIIESKINDNSVHLTFDLQPKAKELDIIKLAVQKNDDKEDELRFLYSFPINIEFGGDFDF